VRKRISKLWVFVSIPLVVVAVFAVVSWKYVWLYATRKSDPPPAIADLLHDPRTSNNPDVLLEEANRLAWLFNWPRAGPLYARAEELFKAKGDTRNEIYARVGRIRAQSETMPWVEVSKVLGQQLELPIAQTDPKLRLWCLAAKGYTDLEINPASAKRAWTEAQDIAHRLGDAQWEARAEGELGIIAFLEGNSRRAAIMVGDAVLSAKASGDVGGQVRMLEMLGNGFNEARRFGEASAFFKRAMKATTSTPDAGFPYMAYEGESYSLENQGRVAEARDKLAKALTVARENQKLGHETMVLQLLGELEMRAGNRQAAMQYLERSRELAQKYDFYRTLAQSTIDLAGLYRDAGDLKSAEEVAAIGVDASRRVGDRYYLPRDLTTLADLKARRGAVRDAEALYENAEDVIDGMLTNLHEAYWTSSLAGAMSVTYLWHFELEAHQGQTEHAFDVLERVRGRTTAALLENKVSLADDESADVRALDESVSELQLRLIRSENTKERADLLDQLVEYERRLEWTRTERTESKSRWFDKPAPLKAVQSALHPDEVVLDYVLSEPNSYCLWIARDATGVQELPEGRKQIEALTRQFLEAVKARRDDSLAAKKLYAILIGQLPPQTSRENVIVVPDGVLHLLPFDLLRDTNGALLLQTRTTSYAPAATVLHVLRSQTKFGVAQHAFLGIGDPLYQNQGQVSAKLEKPKGFQRRLERNLADAFGTSLYDLPETREEVLAASKTIGTDSVVLLGRDATETAFKAQPLADFKIVHIAAHGFADTQFPERSGLVLGLDPASHDDGLLQVREIMRLHFNADLVTLSACNTGIGKIQGEEGVTNLVEAFLVSGAKAVVASLWSADDTYTGKLMERFYTHIAEGQPKARALRQAKLDLLQHDGGNVSPYYWGAFVLVGEGGTPIRLGER
jgi:CHAT domain-containing protein